MVPLVAQKLMEALQLMPMLEFGTLNVKTNTETLEKLLNVPPSRSFRVTDQVFLMNCVSIHLEIAFFILNK